MTREGKKIGLGIVTYQRVNYFKRATKSVRHILDLVDPIAYHDGPQPKDYPAKSCNAIPIVYGERNKGVAHAKNWLFKYFLERGYEYIFIMEDDLEILDRKAIIDYLAAYKITGIPHLLYAHHGPGNAKIEAVIDVMGPIIWWKACVGAWCFYTRDILEKVGLMDEHFNNAWEHVEHTWRIMKYHRTPYGHYPDILDSQMHIKEQPGAIENSSIGSQDDINRVRIILEGLYYWKEKEGETFPAQHTIDHYEEILEELEEVE